MTKSSPTMAPKKLENNLSTNSGAALAACEDLMLCILPRLPVQTICRFKSVCKSWNHLLSTQEFIKLQFKLSTGFKNRSFLVNRVDENKRYTISVYNFESNEKIFYHPYIRTRIDINPAMNMLSKTVSPLKNHGVYEKVSLGFGYDAKGDDFEVVRILLKYKSVYDKRTCVSCVEVYSVNSDSWTTIHPGFQFINVPNQSDVTVNGNPYWLVRVDKNDVLICFDMSKLIFKIVPLSTLDYEKVKQDLEFVDWNGSLGAIVLTWTDMSINVWVFDNVEQVWTKCRSVKMNRDVLYSEFGRRMGTRPKGRLSMFNSGTKCVKDLFSFGRNFANYDYTPSLAYIQGMEKVTFMKSFIELMSVYDPIIF
ncbi:hypothetical protein CASFOL_035232 [Castilleja foliolosa]|uniref:F-box domain-containing protein n=1 Tax=Castilleja foliolosa TaxID=1961234 RepID=A0ABD3BUD1_9LAMI